MKGKKSGAIQHKSAPANVKKSGGMAKVARSSKGQRQPATRGPKNTIDGK